jgi:hypothetical protein
MWLGTTDVDETFHTFYILALDESECSASRSVHFINEYISGYSLFRVGLDTVAAKSIVLDAKFEFFHGGEDSSRGFRGCDAV